jgi:hypothetical protein
MLSPDGEESIPKGRGSEDKVIFVINLTKQA